MVWVSKQQRLLISFWFSPVTGPCCGGQVTGSQVGDSSLCDLEPYLTCLSTDLKPYLTCLSTGFFERSLCRTSCFAYAQVHDCLDVKDSKGHIHRVLLSF